jgi:hypothetical protein
MVFSEITFLISETTLVNISHHIKEPEKIPKANDQEFNAEIDATIATKENIVVGLERVRRKV